MSPQLHMGLVKVRIESYLLPQLYKSIILEERAKRMKAERDYYHLSHYTSDREASTADIKFISQAFEANEDILSSTMNLLLQKEEVNMDEYKSTLVNIAEENSPEPQVITSDPQFKTLDRRSKEWVLRNFTRETPVSAPASPKDIPVRAQTPKRKLYKFLMNLNRSFGETWKIDSR